MTAGRDAPLEARGVSFSYRGPVVRNVSLRLERGTVTGIIGPNGSGKTTLLRLLGGILRPDAGQVVLEGGRTAASLPRRELARRIAVVPQSPGTYFGRTVLEFVLQGRSPHLPLLGFETERDEEIALETLGLARLRHYLHRPVGELSGGERQRLLLARALAQKAGILLLDEFTANLDVNFQIELMRLVKRLTEDNGLATLVVSHEIHLLAGFCDRIALMTGGAIRSEGTVAEVITSENLKDLFGLDFRVRPLDGRAPEVLPVMEEGSRE